MVRRISTFFGGVLLVLATLGVVFVVGMRQKSPPVLNAVRRTSRATKGFVLKSGGAPGAGASVIAHTGRTSGRPYETPISAVPTEEGFVIALPYGLNTDWLKNVLASGAATLRHEGETIELDQPELVPLSVAEPLFPPNDQRTHRLFRIEDYLVLRRVDR